MVVRHLKSSSVIKSLIKTFETMKFLDFIVGMIVLVGLVLKDKLLLGTSELETFLSAFQFYISTMSVVMSFLIVFHLSNSDDTYELALMTMVITLGFTIFLLAFNYYMEMIIVSPLITIITYYLLLGFTSFDYGTRKLPPTISKHIRFMLAFVIVAASYLLLIGSIPNVFIYLISNIRYIFSLLSSFWAMIIIVGLLILGRLNQIHKECFAFFRPIWFYMFYMNAMLLLTGSDPVYIATEAFIISYLFIGGFGNTFSFALILKYLVRDTELKEIGNSAVKQGFFNQNDRLVDTIIVPYKKFFAIPLTLVSILSLGVAYLLVANNIIHMSVFPIPDFFGFLLIPYLSSYFSFSSIIFVSILLIISGVIYLPFVLKFDKAYRNN